MAKVNIDPKNTFKISDLDEISTTNIDDQDSFLITDYHNGKHFTKRISMKKLMHVIVNNPDLINQILEDEEIDREITQRVDDKVEEAFNIQIIDGGNGREDI